MVHTHTRKMNETASGVLSKGAKTCFVFFLPPIQSDLSATYPAPIIIIFKHKTRITLHMRTPVKNFSISEQGVFQVPETGKIGTVNSGVFVSEAQF